MSALHCGSYTGVVRKTGDSQVIPAFPVVLSRVIPYVHPVTNTKQNGTAIKTFREMRGMSRDDLVKRLTGVSYPYLANIENEHKDPTPEVLHRIALALDVPLQAIMRRALYADVA
jgi:DNA-binding XRE family transcriptional regulator